MKMSKYLSFFILTVVLSQVLFSCNKTLDVSSERLSPEENHWKTIQDSRSGLLGVYSLSRAALAVNNAHWMYGELRNGDFTSFNRKDLEAIITGKLNSSFSLIQELADWRRFYAAINAANVFIEKAPLVQKADRLYTEENLNLDIAQVRVLRAFLYYYMIRIWGDVPFINSSFDNGSFPTFPVTDKDQILDYLISDIETNLPIIPYQYGVSPLTYYGYTSNERWEGVLMTKISAYAILAHMNALKFNYLAVERYTDMINTEISSLSTSDLISTEGLTAAGANGFFYGNKVGHLLAFGFNYNFGEATNDGHIENLTLAAPILTKARPDLYVNKDVINEIFVEPGDQRFGVDTISGETISRYFENFQSEIPIFSKIKSLVVDDGTYSKFGSSIVFTRFEEILLLRAESLAVLNRNTDAIVTLNRVRAARGLSSFNSNTLTNREIIDAVFSERRRELLGEGWRWYDIIRYNKIVNNNPDFLQLIASDGIYWPIAESVLQNNKQLSQNPYWN